MTSTTVPIRIHQVKPRAPIMGHLARYVLRVPLVFKVMGANAIIVAVVLLLLGNGLQATEKSAGLVVLGALAIAYVVNGILVRLALSPVAELERVAARVSLGEFGARAQPSLVADSQLSHLTNTVNSLLDSLAAERRRILALGAEVVSAQDTERAKIGRELHDSIAQTLAAVRFQLSAAAGNTADDDLRNSLSTARGMIGKVINDVQNISQSLHPRMTEDLGLVTALEALAHQAEKPGKLKVRVTGSIGNRRVPANVAATLFKIAQESLKSAEARATAGSADILIYANDESICLEVKEGRSGVDSRAPEADNSMSSLASIMGRVELSGGVMRIERGRDGGLCVTAELNAAGMA